MSCFPTSSDPPAQSAQTVNAVDPRVIYSKEWIQKQDSGQSFKVSAKEGDNATFYWIGTSLQVFGIMDSAGTKALFGIDVDGRQGGGATCTPPTSPPPPGPHPLKGGANPQDILLYDYVDSSSQDSHTLFISNKGGSFSLNSFKVFGDSATATSNSSPLISSSSSVLSPTFTGFPSSPIPPTSSISFADSGSLAAPTLSKSVGSTTPISGSSPLASTSTTSSQDGTTAIPTTMPAVSASESYKTSTSTWVGIINGSTTTLLIQTTVEVSATQPYRGPSRGAVAGAAIGGLLFLFLLVGLGLWWWRRRRNRVRFLYGISNLDFDPAMMMRSDAELPTPSLGAGVRDSDGTLYGGDTLPPYKRPASYLSFASDLKKHPPSERAVSAVAGDRRLSTDDERNAGCLPEARSLCDSFLGPGQESVGSVVPPSEERHGAL